MDKSTAAFGQAPQTPQMSESAAQIETGIDLKEVGHMLLLLKRFVDELDEIKLSTDGKGGEMRSARTRNIEGTIESGIFLIDLLLRAGIEPRFRSPLVNLIDRLGMYLSAKGKIEAKSVGQTYN